MNEPSSPTSTPPATSNASDALASLQKQVQDILMILVVVMVLLGGFMAYQWKVNRKALNEIERAYLQVKPAYDRDIPVMTNFLKQLTDYARAHPDYQPVLVKCPLFQTAPAPAAATPATAPPAKAAPAVPTKAPAPAPKK